MINHCNAIEAENLSLTLNSKQIFSDIHLAIPYRAVVGLVGRNGAGKSSLLRSLLGLTYSTSGTSHLLACPSKKLDDHTRERLGYVAQTPDLFSWMQCWQHIETIGLSYDNWTPTRAMNLALKLDLPLKQKVSTLSIGDQQKLSVVLALAHDPDLVLMDEPVASLDPVSRRDFMRAIFDDRAFDDAAIGDTARAKEARTILVSSHILSDLERVVTHVAFMRQGKIQWFDEWDAISEFIRIDETQQSKSPIHKTNTGIAVIDTRIEPNLASAGRVSFDDLFVFMNS